MLKTTQENLLQDNEVRIPQYGPEWVAFVLAGGEVRKGNICLADEAANE